MNTLPPKENPDGTIQIIGGSLLVPPQKQSEISVHVELDPAAMRPGKPFARFSKTFPPPKCSGFRRTVKKRILQRRSNPGAMGYLIKQTSVDNVCNAILEVQHRNPFFSPSIPKRFHKLNQKKQID